MFFWFALGLTVAVDMAEDKQVCVGIGRVVVMYAAGSMWWAEHVFCKLVALSTLGHQK